MIVESGITEDDYRSFNVPPSLRNSLKELHFTFRLFTRINPWSHSSPEVELMDRWIQDHIREKTIRPNALGFPQNVLIAIDLRPRPGFDFSNYPDDGLLGLDKILANWRRIGRAPETVPYANKTGSIHLPKDSRFGLSIQEVQHVLLDLKQLLVPQIDLPEDLIVRLPYYKEIREILLRERLIERIEYGLNGQIREEVPGENTEMSWFNDPEVGMGTSEWCQDVFHDHRKPNRQIGHLYFGRTDAGECQIGWWSSSREGQDKSVITGKSIDDLQRLPRLSFRPVIEFFQAPQVIDSSQR